MAYKYLADKRKHYREWYAKNGRDRAVDYQEAILEWRKNNPEKLKAHNLLYYQIKAGKIQRPSTCSKCNRETRVSGHHLDYTKPLEVLWLCSSCHKLEHLTNHLLKDIIK